MKRYLACIIAVSMILSACSSPQQPVAPTAAASSSAETAASSAETTGETSTEAVETTTAAPETTAEPVSTAETKPADDKVVIELTPKAVQMFGIDEDSKNHDTPFDVIDLHEDGSCTLITTKKKHEAVMKDIKTVVDQSLEQLTDGKQFPDITRVEISDDYTKAKVYFSKDSVTATDMFAAFQIYAMNHIYHIFNATPDANIYVEYINQKTGEVMESGDYRSYLEKHPE